MPSQQPEEHVLTEAVNEFKADRLRAVRKKIRKTRDTIFVTAGLILVSDLLAMAFSGQFSLDAIVISLIISCLFVLLGVLTEKYPFRAILAALILFGILWALQMIVSGPQGMVRGILIKGVILYLLASGLNQAQQAQQLQKELEAS